MATLRQLRRTDSELQAVLPAPDILQAATDTTYQDRGTVYTVVTTVWAFLGQLLHADHSCQRAVHALNAHRAATGQEPVSDDTGGFCKARQRLPEKLCTTLLQRSGQQAESDAPATWNWQGRRVRVVDGSTLKVADSPANRAAFPLRKGWVPGISYSVVRILVAFSLVTGSVVNGLLVPYQGKGNGETAMLRALADHFERDDVLLGDGYFSGYWDLVWWQQRGVAVVSRLANNRRADFRRGRQPILGNWRCVKSVCACSARVFACRR
jgi:putative transposase